MYVRSNEVNLLNYPVLQWQYAKKARTDDSDMSALTPSERAFHDSMRPSWGPDGTLVYGAASNPQPYAKPSRRARERDGLLTIQKGSVVSENRDIRFAKFANEVSVMRIT
jgi:nuclear pore complex protein Nup98-Nup96